MSQTMKCKYHGCGCRDDTFKGDKHVYRVKWCDAHYAERCEWIKNNPED